MTIAAAPPGVERSIPRPALILGAGGAVPFVAFTFAVWLAPPAFAAWAQHALVTYAMIILTFVGALHWGFTMKTPEFDERDRWTWMGWSVVPALAAWGAGMLPFRVAVALLVATFVVHLALDHRLAPLSGLPAWYLRLRRLLTAVVVCSLLAAAVR
ncbi:MAG: DUF3429 domain-containing protein [Betaproteobacteria bacterium]|nr:DUF3429 domain-containing protein [Betaproteobacteria bacterium]